MIKRFTRRPGAAIAAGFLVLAATSLAPSFAAAQDAKAVARIGGYEITESDLNYIGADFAKEMQRVPAEQRRKILLGILIDMNIMASAAEKAGVGGDKEFVARMKFLRRRTLRNIYFINKIRSKISTAEVKAAYDKRVGGFKSKPQVRARHILVKTEEAAKAIIKALDEGGNFAKLAAEKSDGPSKARGGDLGYFADGQMVPAFSAAAFALEKGAYTKAPVKTRFGWHVILIEDKRVEQAPTMESLDGELRQNIIREKFQAELARLKAITKVEILDETLKPKPAAPVKKPADGGQEKPKKATE